MVHLGSTDATEAEHGFLLDGGAVERAVAEPLRESAPVAFQLAMACCRSPEGGASCRPYHAVWQYLRLAGEARSVKVDGALYVAAAERLARQGRLRRVLITATADYSLMAHLALGARRGGAAPVFHVVDRCETSLRMNRWYADEMELALETTQSDVLDFASSQRFDLISAHSFVQWLPAADRPRLFALWRRHLTETGRVCFSNRVWDRHFRYPAAEMAERVERIVKSVLPKLQAIGVPLPCPQAEFAELLRGFGNRRAEHAPLPLADLRDWIDRAGLALEIAVEAGKQIAGVEEKVAGPFPSTRGPRMWFQAKGA